MKDGCIIGRGWHERCGGLHAERAALADCREDPAGGRAVRHLGALLPHRPPAPCTEAILAAGIRRVVVGSMDPNPLVAGKGVELLRTHGVEVETGVLREQCDALNPVFFHYIRTKRPYVVMKYAMTLDGKIAAYTGASRWITREAARRHVHEMRHRYRGILAGVVPPPRAGGHPPPADGPHPPPPGGGKGRGGGEGGGGAHEIAGGGEPHRPHPPHPFTTLIEVTFS